MHVEMTEYFCTILIPITTTSYPELNSISNLKPQNDIHKKIFTMLLSVLDFLERYTKMRFYVLIRIHNQNATLKLFWRPRKLEEEIILCVIAISSCVYGRFNCLLI